MCLFTSLFGVYLTTILSIDVLAINFYWRDYEHEDMPCDAFEAAPGLYIGQVRIKEHNTVANIYPSTGHAIIENAGDIIIVEDDVKIMCSTDQGKFYWEEVDLDKPQDNQLQNAVRGGYKGNKHDPLYIGKVLHQDEWKIGKVLSFKHNEHRGIWVWNQRQQPVNMHKFHILKATITERAGIPLQDFYWRDYVPGNIPSDAFEGAPGRYVGQMLVKHDDRSNIQPATIYPDTNTAVSELFGKKTTKKDIKILCSPSKRRFYWEYADFTKPEDTQLDFAVKGGSELGNTYIGKVLHEQEWKIGKVIPFEGDVHKGLHIWNERGDAVHLRQCMVLKYNSTKTSHSGCYN